MTAVVARFAGGPLDGELRALEEAAPTLRFPLLLRTDSTAFGEVVYHREQTLAGALYVYDPIRSCEWTPRPYP